MKPRPPRAPSFIRRLAELIIRGPSALFIIADLDEAYERDVERGLGAGHARYRYAVNALGSFFALARERVRVARLPTSWLDLKLSVRMLSRQPGLTAVAVFALGLGIPASMIPSHLTQVLSFGTLPFEDGDRIVGVQNWDVEASGPDFRSLHDFELWQSELRSFELLGASTSRSYNVIATDGRAEPVRGAQVTATTFAIVGVAPELGRPLLASDEIPGAPDVVVLGYGLWQGRLGGAPDAVGRTIHVGGTPHEVVGIMPEGFLFPARDHLWLPLRARSLDYEQGAGPTLRVYGRLADGVTTDQAHVEVETVGLRLAAASPETHGHLRAEVVRYTRLGQDIDPSENVTFILMNIAALLLLLIACGNVGILVLARTAMRSSEIAIRTALGAGRRQIVLQIFFETLVMALAAVGLGLLLSQFLAGMVERYLAHLVPFWLDFGVRPRTVFTALGLAVLSATLAGVIPALRATGSNVHHNLQRASAGVSSMRFGGLSSALIVAEVAIAVGFLTMGGSLTPGALAPRTDMGIDPREYLSAEVRLPWIEPAADQVDTYAAEFSIHNAEMQRELARRLSNEPEVEGFGFADGLPGESNPSTWIEVEGEAGVEGFARFYVRTVRVEVEFFRNLDHPIVAGRDFERSDVPSLLDNEREVAIVNSTLVEEALRGRNPLGKRIRQVERGGTQPGPWLEIVGVVGRFGMNGPNPQWDAGFYRPVAPGDLHPARVAIRTRGEPASFAPRLRELAAEVEPSAIVLPRPMDEILAQQRLDNRWGVLLFGVIAAVAIVLSTAGLYALVSFTISQRTKEIGIRRAIGAPPGSIVMTVGRRALLQLTGGVTLGAILSLLLVPRVFSGPSTLHLSWPVLVAVVAGGTLMVGLASCVPPTLRGLRIRPVDALKQE